MSKHLIENFNSISLFKTILQFQQPPTSLYNNQNLSDPNLTKNNLDPCFDSLDYKMVQNPICHSTVSDTPSCHSDKTSCLPKFHPRIADFRDFTLDSTKKNQTQTIHYRGPHSPYTLRPVSIEIYEESHFRISFHHYYIIPLLVAVAFQI